MKKPAALILFLLAASSLGLNIVPPQDGEEDGALTARPVLRSRTITRKRELRFVGALPYRVLNFTTTGTRGCPSRSWIKSALSAFTPKV